MTKQPKYGELKAGQKVTEQGRRYRVAAAERTSDGQVQVDLVGEGRDAGSRSQSKQQPGRTVPKR